MSKYSNALSELRVFFSASCTVSIFVISGCVKNVQQGPIHLKNSLNLVKIMKWDRAFLVGGRGLLAQSASTVAQREKFLACTDTADLTSISTLIAGRIDSALSSNEIEDAIYFYKRPAGQKYILRDLEVGNSEVLGNVQPVIHFSSEELSEIELFTKSPAGTKLIKDVGPIIDGLVREVSPLVNAVVADCASKTMKNN